MKTIKKCSKTAQQVCFTSGIILVFGVLQRVLSLNVSTKKYMCLVSLRVPLNIGFAGLIMVLPIHLRQFLLGLTPEFKIKLANLFGLKMNSIGITKPKG